MYLESSSFSNCSEVPQMHARLLAGPVQSINDMDQSIMLSFESNSGEAALSSSENKDGFIHVLSS